MNKNKHIALGILMVAMFLVASCGGGKPNYKVSLKNDTDSISYYFGYFNGRQFASQGLDEINTDAVAKGWQDALKKVELDKSDEEVNMFFQKYFAAAQTRLLEKNLKEGQDFLEENKKKSGVVTLTSGLQYKIIQDGSGDKPTMEDMVDIVYKGTLIDGTEFDNSNKHGDTVTFPVGGVVPGFSEALTLMSEGSIWEVYIPSDLGYGSNPRPGGLIKPNSVLIFELNLVRIKQKDE